MPCFGTFRLPKATYVHAPIFHENFLATAVAQQQQYAGGFSSRCCPVFATSPARSGLGVMTGEIEKPVRRVRGPLHHSCNRIRDRCHQTSISRHGDALFVAITESGVDTSPFMLIVPEIIRRRAVRRRHHGIS